MNGRAPAVPPFPPGYRASGVLLHVTSLPSAWGIGDLGPAAFRWVDHLHDAGQRFWQALPLGPTGYGDSPYQPLSSFAGNELLISPDGLIEDGLLRAADCRHDPFPTSTVEYERVVPFKTRLLEIARTRFGAGVRRDLRSAYEAFRHTHASWLEDYALFSALKERHAGLPYRDWPADLVRRDPAALDRERRDLAAGIERVRFAQFLLARQAEVLGQYAHERGLRLIGDLPFFVSPDSCDVWANPGLFLLDRDHLPTAVAGVPPDAFSADGQRWGNPVYDWEALRRDGHRFWIDRLRALLSHVDVIRLDHFRGFAAAWHVPATAATAKEGAWVPGPGAGLFRALGAALGGLPVIAEDLGTITPDVTALREEFHIPGTRVLQFGFDGDPHNPHRPDRVVRDAVVYTGTHDNPTTRAWYDDLPADRRGRLWSALGRGPGGATEAAPALLSLAWSSNAALAVAPLQDVLNLGREARMNRPGCPAGNWRWRIDEGLLEGPALESLRDLTGATARLEPVVAAVS